MILDHLDHEVMLFGIPDKTFEKVSSYLPCRFNPEVLLVPSYHSQLLPQRLFLIPWMSMHG